MTEENEDEFASRIDQRLEDVLTSIMCPIAGCWGLHGAETFFYHDLEADSYGLVVWHVAFKEPADDEGNGDEHAREGLCFEFAEFDFLDLMKKIPLERFHFSQREAVFEIG